MLHTIIFFSPGVPYSLYRGCEATELRRTLFEVSFPAKRLELDRKIRAASSRFVRYEC